MQVAKQSNIAARIIDLMFLRGKTPLGVSSPGAWIAALSESETNYYIHYASNFPGNAWQLNQDPTVDHGMMSMTSILHTLIHNAGLIFCDSYGERSDEPRWLSGTETLVAQGFPVHGALHGYLLAIRPPITSFAVRMPGRSPRLVAEQAGNSMHLGCLLPQLMYDYQGVRLISDNPMVRSLNLHKRLRASQHEDAQEEHSKNSRPRHVLASECT